MGGWGRESEKIENTPNRCPNGVVPILDHERPTTALLRASRDGRLCEGCLNLRDAREQTQQLS